MEGINRNNKDTGLRIEGAFNPGQVVNYGGKEWEVDKIVEGGIVHLKRNKLGSNKGAALWERIEVKIETLREGVLESDVQDVSVEDAYNVLGINKQTTFEEVEKRFRELIKESHPDAIDGSDEKVRRVIEAMDIIRKHVKDHNSR